MALEDKLEYVNTTQGWVGAIQINRKGDELAVAVAPGTRVFLNAEERELTARAHARRVDSPFEVHHIVHWDLRSGDVIKEFDAPMLMLASELDAAGHLADGEEVATPSAALAGS